jgi:BirA family transcriptional regulator, biotin operon repressor / biotin---[acetyl-CoA-carboxylase] ligase
VAGSSLTFSLCLPLRVGDWSGLSLAVGVALADALDPLDAVEAVDGFGPHRAAQTAEPRAPRIGLKWPNDLWLADGSGRKLGGILVETVSAGAQRVAVIGVGLNVRALAPHPGVEAMASLQEFDAAASAPSTLHRVAAPLLQAMRRFEHEGFAPLRPRFAARDLLLGRPVRTTQADVPEGVASGVTDTGALLVRTPSGLRSVHSGEVSVRPMEPPSARAATPALQPGQEAPC